MKCLEVAAAVLAEVLIQNGVNIDVETKCIHWPIADIATGPPTNVVNKGKGTGTKVPKKLISGKSGKVFGQIVNYIQAKKSASYVSDSNSDASPLTSGYVVEDNSCTTLSHSEEIAGTQTHNTTKRKGNGVKTARRVGLPVRARNGNLYGHGLYLICRLY